MTSRLKWISCLLLLNILLILWVISALVLNPWSCLQSSLVAQVEIRGESGNKDIFYHCSRTPLRERLFPRSAWDSNRAFISSEVRALSRLQEILPPVQNPIYARILESSPFEYFVSGSQMDVGSAVFRAKGQFKRAVLVSWLSQIYAHTTLDSYDLEVLADFYLGLIQGREVIEHPSTGDVVYASQLSWIYGFQTFQQYCDSNFLSLVHWNYCQHQAGGLNGGSSWLDATSSMWTIWSFRPILSQAIREYFNLLTLSEKTLFLKTLAHGPTAEQDSRLPQDYDSTAAFYNWFLQSLRRFIPEVVMDEGRLQVVLERLKIFLRPSADILIEIEREQARQMVWDTFIQTFSNSDLNKRVVLKVGPIMYALNPGQPIYLDVENDLDVSELVKVSCELPLVDDIRQRRAEFVWLVRWCGGDETLNWPAFLTNSYSQRRQAAINNEFVQLHLPSLELAASLNQQMLSVSVENFLLQGAEVLGWDRVHNLPSGLYLPDGPISAVLSFRLNQEPK